MLRGYISKSHTHDLHFGIVIFLALLGAATKVNAQSEIDLLAPNSDWRDNFSMIADGGSGSAGSPPSTPTDVDLEGPSQPTPFDTATPLPTQTPETSGAECCVPGNLPDSPPPSTPSAIETLSPIAQPSPPGTPGPLPAPLPSETQLPQPLASPENSPAPPEGLPPADDHSPTSPGTNPDDESVPGAEQGVNEELPPGGPENPSSDPDPLAFPTANPPPPVAPADPIEQPTPTTSDPLDPPPPEVSPAPGESPQETDTPIPSPEPDGESSPEPDGEPTAEPTAEPSSTPIDQITLCSSENPAVSQAAFDTDASATPWFGDLASLGYCTPPPHVCPAPDQMRSESSMQTLVACLDDDDFWTRQRASERIVELLTNALCDAGNSSAVFANSEEVSSFLIAVECHLRAQCVELEFMKRSSDIVRHANLVDAFTQIAIDDTRPWQVKSRIHQIANSILDWVKSDLVVLAKEGRDLSDQLTSVDNVDELLPKLLPLFKLQQILIDPPAVVSGEFYPQSTFLSSEERGGGFWLTWGEGQSRVRRWVFGGYLSLGLRDLISPKSILILILRKDISRSEVFLPRSTLPVLIRDVEEFGLQSQLSIDLPLVGLKRFLIFTLQASDNVFEQTVLLERRVRDRLLNYRQSALDDQYFGAVAPQLLGLGN